MEVVPLRVFLTTVLLLASSSTAQMLEERHALILKTIIASIENLAVKLDDLHSKLAVLEGLEEINGAVKECSSRKQVEDIKTLLLTDECQDNSHQCSDVAICTNEIIHYSCTCHAGFSGDGFTCQDINECEEEVHGCHPTSVCTNNIGSYHCSCASPYTGDGFVCDINECEMGTHDCHANSICVNTIDSYECSCNAPFVGDGITCDPCQWPSIHLSDYGCIVPKPDCQWPSINLPDLGCISPTTDGMSWDKAKEKCRESGKRLIEDFNATHIKLFSELYLPLMNDSKQPWIGARDSKWLTSGESIADDLFKDGEPDGGEERCNYLNLGNTKSIGIGDVKCSSNGRAICQFIY